MLVNYNKVMKKSGFTLIELLVVVAIIGLLSSVVLASLDGARKKARDARRLAEIQEIAKAIQFYYDDNGHYPPGENLSGNANGYVGEGARLDTYLAPYMPTVPHDPLGPGSPMVGSYKRYSYYYDGYQSCGGHPNQAVLAVAELETSAGNRDNAKCSSWGGEGRIGTARSFNIVFGPSSTSN